MKKNLLLVASLFAGFFASAQEVDANGYTTVAVDMLPNYANQVFYKLSTNTQTPVAAASWDIAFYKAEGGQKSLGAIRTNDQKVTALYESGVASTYATTNVANVAQWTKLYNSATSWSTGAFNTASDTSPFGYNWGVYNMDTHHVVGTRVFVLQTAAGYTKLIIEDLDPANQEVAEGPKEPLYTIKSSKWSGTEWSADVISKVRILNSSTADAAYLSLDTNALVTVAPADTNWDFVFTKYIDEVTMGTTTAMYNVTGALHNKSVKVSAVAGEVGETATFTPPAGTTYSADINKIGDKWKAFSGTAYTIPANTYYIKSGDKYYRLYFLSFEGQGTGKLTFKYKEITDDIVSVEDFNKTSFSVYPNPTVDKNVTISHNIDAKGTVSVYTLTGAQVSTGELSAGSQNLNLSSLSAGIYIVKIEAGNQTATQKLIVQ